MFRRTVSEIMLTLLLISTLSLTFNIQPVKATGTIYIRANGSIDPPTAPISTVDKVTYTLTSDIISGADGIIIERNDIRMDGNGYSLQGFYFSTFGSKGIDLSGRTNVTVQNMQIQYFWYGISLNSSSNNRITGNTITENDMYGIWLSSSSNNSITGNTIKSSIYWNIWLLHSSNNSISGNTIMYANNEAGITLAYSSNNCISGNIITYNSQLGAIELYKSSNNVIYHNNFINNIPQVYIRTPGYANFWDNGYPSGGNYWSDYTGAWNMSWTYPYNTYNVYHDLDLYSGLYQDETGSDGIADTKYTIDTNNIDHYPLMKPYPWALHDIGITSVECPGNATGWGYNATINLMLFNYGNYSETFSVRVYANETLLGEFSSIELTSRNFTILPYVWNSSVLSKGNHKIKAVTDTVPGELEIADNTLIDGWVLITGVGDLGGNAPPEFFNFDNLVDGVDLALFIECYKGLAPPEAMHLADLGGGLPPKFFACDGKVDGMDLALFIACYKGLGPP